MHLLNIMTHRMLKKLLNTSTATLFKTLRLRFSLTRSSLHGTLEMATIIEVRFRFVKFDFNFTILYDQQENYKELVTCGILPLKSLKCYVMLLFLRGEGIQIHL